MKKSLFHAFKYSMLCLLVSGCTYSINMIHSEGTATDMIDETDKPTLTANIPLTSLPK